jgi:hypothetical protein
LEKVAFDHNTVFRRDRLTKQATSAPRVLSRPVLGHILGAMTDAEDLARRYLNLWQDYLTALMADLRGPGLLQIWIAAYSALAGNPPPRDPAAVEQARPSGPTAGTAPVAGTSRERDDLMVGAASRLARVEDRLAARERLGQTAARRHGRDRSARN